MLAMKMNSLLRQRLVIKFTEIFKTVQYISLLLMSLCQIHGLSSPPKYFLDSDHTLLLSGSTLSYIDITDGTINHLWTLNTFDSISCLTSNPFNSKLLLAIQSKNEPSLHLFNFKHQASYRYSLNLINKYPSKLETNEHSISEENDFPKIVGYSHIEISQNTSDELYVVSISNVPHLQLQYWKLEQETSEPQSTMLPNVNENESTSDFNTNENIELLASMPMITDNIKWLKFSPTSTDLFVTANETSITLWRVYYKFDAYFLTCMTHNICNLFGNQNNDRYITCLTFGEQGTEIIYGTNLNEIVIIDENTINNISNEENVDDENINGFESIEISDEENDDGNYLVFHKMQNIGCISHLLFTRFYLIVVFADDGMFEWLSISNLELKYQWSHDCSIKHCQLLPNYTGLLIVDENDALFRFDFNLSKILIMDGNESAHKSTVNDTMIDDDIIQSHKIWKFNQAKDKNVCCLQTETRFLINKMNIECIQINKECHSSNISNVSTMNMFHFAQNIDLIVLGFISGYIGIAFYDEKNGELKMFWTQKLFQTCVKQIEFSTNGRYIACIAEESTKIWFILLPNTSSMIPKILGYYSLNDIPFCFSWINDMFRDLKIIISLPFGCVLTYDQPLMEDMNSDMKLQLQSNFVHCEVDFSFIKIMHHPYFQTPDHLLCLTENHELIGYILDEDSSVFVDDKFEKIADHEITDIDVHSSGLLMTVGTDGCIHIRKFNDKHPLSSTVIFSIYAHDAFKNGIICGKFSFNGEYILSVGYDQSVISWKLNGKHSQMHRKMIKCPISRSNLEDISQVFIEENTSTFEEKWESKCIQTIVQKFEPLKIEIQSQIKHLRIQYSDIIEKQKELLDDENLKQLEKHELIVDRIEHKKLLNMNSTEISKVKQSITDKNIANSLITQRIKQQFWDSMEHKLQITHGIHSTEKTQIRSFPILSQTKSKQQLITKLKFLRSMSIMANAYSKQTQDRNYGEFDEIEILGSKRNDIRYIWDINENTAVSNIKNDEKEQKKNIIKKHGYIISDELNGLLFHPMSLYTNFRKRIQIILIEERIKQFKIQFNKELSVFFKLKLNAIEKVNEKKVEINEIQNELQLHLHSKNTNEKNVDLIKLSKVENYELNLFQVQNSEIQIEKVLNVSEIQQKERLRAEQQAREKNANNDTVQRALKDMMNGTLASKDDVEKLKDKLLKKPAFLTKKPINEWTEEENIIFVEYENKKKQLIKAQDIRTKLLNTRLKNLKNDISDICKNIDMKIIHLQNKRLLIIEYIFVHELMIIHVRNNILEYEIDFEKNLEDINAELLRLKEDKCKADETFLKFNLKLNESKKILENAQIEEKCLEKNFKKDILKLIKQQIVANNNNINIKENMDIYYEYLCKLFRGKKCNLPKSLMIGKSEQPYISRNSSSINIRRRSSFNNMSSIDISVAVNKERKVSEIQQQSIIIANASLIENEQLLDSRSINPYFDENRDVFELENVLENKTIMNQTLMQNSRAMNISQYSMMTSIANTVSAETLSISLHLPLKNCTKPSELNNEIWNKFCEYRKLKYSKECGILHLLTQNESMEAEVNALKNNQSFIKQSINNLFEHKKNIIRKQRFYDIDSELFFKIKQGFLEYNESFVVTDIRQSIMIDKKLILNLNSIIKCNGEEFLKKLNEIKEYRKGINCLNWKNEYLDVQYQYWKLLTTEYQLRRVTKKDQQNINGGGQKNGSDNNLDLMTKLENKMKFLKYDSSKKLKSLKSKVTKFSQKSMNLENENKFLTKEILKMKIDIQSKNEIIDIQSSSVGMNANKNSMKMDSIVTHRKLVDLVKAQSAEIDFLNIELNRLRKKTFPSFAVAK